MRREQGGLTLAEDLSQVVVAARDQRQVWTDRICGATDRHRVNAFWRCGFVAGLETVFCARVSPTKHISCLPVNVWIVLP